EAFTRNRHPFIAVAARDAVLALLVAREQRSELVIRCSLPLPSVLPASAPVRVVLAGHARLASEEFTAPFVEDWPRVDTRSPDEGRAERRRVRAHRRRRGPSLGDAIRRRIGLTLLRVGDRADLEGREARGPVRAALLHHVGELVRQEPAARRGR